MFALSLLRVRLLLFLLCGVCSVLLRSMEVIKKDQIEDFIRRKTISVTGSQTWNTDGNKCAWVTFDTNSFRAKNLKLTVVGLVDGGKRIVSNTRSWRNFYFPVFEDDVRPWFKDGRACFYGYGNVEDEDDVTFNFVGEYSLDVDGTAEHYECICYTPSGSMRFDYFKTLTGLLHFPVLMKALLQSTKVFKREFNDGCKKAFYPEPSNFPKDYKKYKQHLGLEKIEDELDELEIQEFKRYGSYDDLPMSLKAAFQVQGW